MGKFSNEDKMRIQTLCEQGLGYKKIVAAYPQKQWKLMSVKEICKRFKLTGCEHVWRLMEGTLNTSSDKFFKEFITNGPFQGPHNKRN